MNFTDLIIESAWLLGFFGALFLALIVFHVSTLYQLMQSDKTLDSIIFPTIFAAEPYPVPPSDQLPSILDDISWGKLYKAFVLQYSPNLSKHYEFVPIYPLLGLLGTVSSIAFTGTFDSGTQLGVALITTGVGITLAIIFRMAGSSMSSKQTAYASHYRMLEQYRVNNGLPK